MLASFRVLILMGSAACQVLRLLPDSAMLEAGEWCSVSKIDENRPFTTIVVVVSWWRCPDHDVVARCQVKRLQGVRC